MGWLLTNIIWIPSLEVFTNLKMLFETLTTPSVTPQNSKKDQRFVQKICIKVSAPPLSYLPIFSIKSEVK